ncbi:MAG: SIMPL domain-containing protein, partial [Brevundimonas sp.]
INDLSKVGATADAVVTAGVNQIDGIAFGLKDAKAAEDQARQLAVRALQDKARLYAQALGVQLGGVRTLTEGGGYMPEPPRPMYARAMAMDAGSASTPVSAGELTVRIDISGTYDIGR